MHSIVQAVWQHARQTPEKCAVEFGGKACSYAELWSSICAAAVKLRPFGGKIILLPAEKRLECLAYYLGAHLAGVANLLVDPKISADALEKILQVLHPACTLPLACGVPPNASILDWELPADCAQNAAYDFPAASAVADYMFTTGTTGGAKCVPLTQGNILAAATNINTFIGNDKADRELVALPLCHSFGMGRVRCQLLAGGTAVLIPNFANERKVLKTLQNGGITGFAMVPAAWLYLKNLCAEKLAEAGRGLRYIEFGSAALPVEEKRLLMQLFPNTRLCMHYGLTEASRSAFIEFHEESDHLGTVGRPSPNTEISIFSENGIPQPCGVEGEVCVKGAHVTPGYLNQPPEASFYGNYFRTGDCGHLDGEGYLHLSGRLKEIINVGGKKVSPDEVDAQLALFPGIRECACTAAPDPDGILGEVVKAHILLSKDAEQPSDEELRHFLHGRLEAHKIPRLFCYRDEPLPRTASGKLQRQMLN